MKAYKLKEIVNVKQENSLESEECLAQISRWMLRLPDSLKNR